MAHHENYCARYRYHHSGHARRWYQAGELRYFVELLKPLTAKKVAKTAGISVRTLYRKLQELPVGQQ